MFASLSPADVPLHIVLFGPFTVHIHGTPMPQLRNKTGSFLLAALAVSSGQKRSRQDVANELWPNSEPEVALRNLRRSLTNLRSVLGDEQSRTVGPVTPSQWTLRARTWMWPSLRRL
jgi:DNA-binding SARP family transcriptional activator